MSQTPYPLLNISSATTDNAGISVTAEITSPGGTAVTEFGIAYKLRDFSKEEIRVKAPSASDTKFSYQIKDHLEKNTVYEFRAYALVGDKTVYSDLVQAKSLITSAPVITDFSPKEGPSGTEVTITGTSFPVDKSKVRVYIGGMQLNVVSSTPTKIIVRVYTWGIYGSFPLRVVINGVEGKSDQHFRIWGPEITRLSRSHGLPGDTLTLFGKDLEGNNLQISLNHQPFKILSSSDTKVKLEVPTHTYDYFDRPFPLILSTDKGTATSPVNFTVSTNLKEETYLRLNYNAEYRPGFEVNGKGYFYDYYNITSYHPASKTWKTESNAPWRNSPIWERVGDKAYVIGGYLHSTRYSEVWELDLSLNTWKKLDNLPFSVHNAASFVLDGKIYFGGGINSRNDNYTLWQYDPATQQVVAQNQLPGYVTAGNTFILKGKAHLLIGQDIFSFNQTSNSWEKEITHSISKPFAITIGDSKLFLLSKTDNQFIHQYEADTKVWKKVAYFPHQYGNNQYLRFTGFSTANKFYIGSYLAGSYGDSQFYSYTP
ncbi:IPT/TIG domain-containing protein [Pontibacter beigongshangensis]|uniref:IPT/TIG domain-containing protein n=1 Tax=Pontibacter beigongshangensis TaxID=2574733 RepID=UPI00164EE485|nr:IPT/TIG domain-containing protein [Pontibacter beigongshangensis]